MQNQCTGNAPFLTAFQATKPNGNKGAPVFSESERIVFLGCIHDEVGANGKRAIHMEQGFQPRFSGFVDCIFLRASACGGAIENTAIAHSERA